MLKALEALLFSNVWIALSAGTQVYVGCRLLGLSPDRQLCLLSFLSMFWVYTFAKAVHFDPQADQANDPTRTAFLLRYRWILIACGLTGLACGIWLCSKQNGLALAAFILPTVAGLFYDLKFFPQSFRYRRLKEIPGVKGLTVALAWGAMPCGLILAFQPSADRTSLFLFGLWSTLLWFFNTTYFDLGDVRGDRIEGTRTLPIVVGYERTKLLLHGVNALLMLVWWQAQKHGLFDECGGLLWLVGVYHWMLLGRAWGENADLQWECDLCADGMMVAAAALVWVGAG
jgi:4-hydroxybenzoate polyprenyltransferase